IEARIVVANESFARELGARFGISGATGKPGDRSSLGYGGDLDSSGSNAQSRADAVMEGERAFDISRSLMTNLPSTLGGSGALALDPARHHSPPEHRQPHRHRHARRRKADPRQPDPPTPAPAHETSRPHRPSRGRHPAPRPPPAPPPQPTDKKFRVVSKDRIV